VPEGAPPQFARAVQSLRAARLRPELTVEEVPAPQRIAPYAVAVTADVVDRDEDLASGRFVLLHDPDGQEGWDGTCRVVALARAALEVELGSDPMLAQVGWSWLTDSLELAGAQAHALGGTVTRVLSESFASLADRPATVEIEVRASWTPDVDDLGPHLTAWGELLCTVAGLPPLPSGVAPLPRRRR
jgi:hypothetical protein